MRSETSRALALLSILIAAALAGCIAGQEAPPDDDGPDGNETTEDDENVTMLQHAGMYTRAISQPFLLGLTQENSNCMEFKEGLDVILSGNVTATWTPNDDFSREIEIVADGRDNRSRATGESPLELAFESLYPEGDGNDTPGVQFAIQLNADLGVVIDQQVELDIRFDYLGDAGIEPNLNWICDFG